MGWGVGGTWGKTVDWVKQSAGGEGLTGRTTLLPRVVMETKGREGSRGIR